MALPYRNVVAWRRAQELAFEIDELAERGRWRPWLRDQICRAAYSVGANIAEGNGRSTPLDYASFVDRARGSLYEVDSWLDVCARKGLLPEETAARLGAEAEELGRMLFALGRRLRGMDSLRSR